MIVGYSTKCINHLSCQPAWHLDMLFPPKLLTQVFNVVDQHRYVNKRVILRSIQLQVIIRILDRTQSCWKYMFHVAACGVVLLEKSISSQNNHLLLLVGISNLLLGHCANYESHVILPNARNKKLTPGHTVLIKMD
jgi:hypothetical protein